MTRQCRNTIRGCPQGSSFGPLLWNSFQNDLAYITEGEISMYTDDHQIFASGSSTSIVEGKLLSEGNKITKWYKENLLQLNDHQSSYWALGLRQITKHKPADIDGLNIEQLKSFIDKRYVGQILVSRPSIIIHVSVKLLLACMIC